MKDPPDVTDEAIAVLSGYDFPGNVRELKSIVFDTVGRMTSRRIDGADIRQRIGAAGTETTAGEQWRSALRFPEVLPTLREASLLLIREALERTGGNISAAARLSALPQSALSKRLSRATDRETEHDIDGRAAAYEKWTGWYEYRHGLRRFRTLAAALAFIGSPWGIRISPDHWNRYGRDRLLSDIRHPCVNRARHSPAAVGSATDPTRPQNRLPNRKIYPIRKKDWNG
jgi:hypothetical protein